MTSMTMRPTAMAGPIQRTRVAGRVPGRSAAVAAFAAAVRAGGIGVAATCPSDEALLGAGSVGSRVEGATLSGAAAAAGSAATAGYAAAAESAEASGSAAAAGAFGMNCASSSETVGRIAGLRLKHRHKASAK